eukprot:tig00020537_g10303.t1
MLRRPTRTNSHTKPEMGASLEINDPAPKRPRRMRRRGRTPVLDPRRPATGHGELLYSTTEPVGFGAVHMLQPILKSGLKVRIFAPKPYEDGFFFVGYGKVWTKVRQGH